MHPSHLIKIALNPSFSIAQSGLADAEEKLLTEALSQSEIKAFFDKKAKKEAQQTSMLEQEFQDLLKTHQIEFPAAAVQESAIVYEQLLPYVKLAAKLDSSNSVRVKLYAAKLAMMFGSVRDSLTYLDKVEKQSPGTTIEKACAFSPPQTNGWNISLWQSLAVKHMPDNPRFYKILPYAKEIELYVEKNRKVFEVDLKNEIEAQWALRFSTKFDESVSNTETEAKGEGELNKLKADYIAKAMSEKSNRALIANEIKTKSQKLLSKNTDVSTLVGYAEAVYYKKANSSPRAREAASNFFSYDIKEEIYNRYLALKPSNNTAAIPDISLKDGVRDSAYPGLYIVKLDPSDPRNAVVGKITSCCQSLGAAGDLYAERSIIDPTYGCYVLCRAKRNKAPNPATDEIVAESLVWRSQSGNIVMDSIEGQPVFRRDHEQAITDMFSLLGEKLTQEKGIPQVLVGTGGLTPKSIGLLSPLQPEFPINDLRQRDSYKQRIVSDKTLPVFALHQRETNGKLAYVAKGTEKAELKEQLEKQLIRFVGICVENDKNLEYIQKNIDLFLAPQADKKQALEMVGEIYQRIVNYKALINTFGPDGWEKETRDKLEDIFNHNVECNMPDKTGVLPLKKAIEMGNINMVRIFIERGAQFDFIEENLSKDKKTPFVDFVLKKSSPMDPELPGLLKLCAEKNKEGAEKLFTKLLLQISEAREKNKSDVELVAILVQNGANVNTEEAYRSVPLASAIRNNNAELAEWFLTHGANAKSVGKALLDALQEKNGPWIARLMKAHPDMNVLDNYSGTPLSVAIEKDHKEIVQIILQQNLTAENLGRALVAAAMVGNMEWVQSLLAKGAALNMSDNTGKTALMLAAERGDLPMVELLVKHKAEVNVRNSSMHTPLSYAADKGRQAVVEYLIKISDEESKARALTEAARTGKADMVEFLLSNGADVNLDQGKALSEVLYHMAEKENFEKIKNLLIKKANSKTLGIWLVTSDIGYEELMKAGADVNARVSRGYREATVLSEAVSRNDQATRNLLMRETLTAENMGLALLREFESESGSSARKADLEFAEELIQRGADLTIKDRTDPGKTDEISSIKERILKDSSWSQHWLELFIKYNIFSTEELEKCKENLISSRMEKQHPHQISRTVLVLSYVEGVLAEREKREAELKSKVEKLKTKSTDKTTKVPPSVVPMVYSEKGKSALNIPFKEVQAKEKPSVPGVLPPPPSEPPQNK